MKPPKFTGKLCIQLLTETGTAFMAHKAPRMGAALAYYTAFSLAPLLVLMFSIASLIWTGQGEAVTKITRQANDTIGPQATAAVQEILQHAAENHGASWGAVISFIVLIFSASGAFGELQDALNQIWDVPPQKQAFVAMIKQRVLSFGMVLVLGFFMMVSLGLSTVTYALVHSKTLRDWMGGSFPAGGVDVANNFISFLLFSGLFATIFRLLPDVPLRWRDVLPGALFSAALFIIGKTLLAWYIGESSSFSAYGAAGSFVIILLWVYYSAQILYLGAEFTRAYSKRYGSHLEAQS